MATKIEHRSLLYVPDGPGPHPVLCFLHGAGEAATKDEEGTQPQSLAKILENQSPAWHAEKGSPFVSRFLVVCPQLSKRRRWGGNKLEFLREDTTVVEALVTTAIRDHHGDASRLILTGFSFGGEGAFQVASVSKLTWSTIWAVDPALQRVPPVPAPSVRVWVHHGNEQPGAPSMGDFANALDLQPSNGVPTARRVMTALKTNHPETCIAAYAEARVYDWLLR